MSSFSTNKRAAAIGMAGALALGTVASVGSMTTADGAELATTYTCTLATGPMDLPVTGSLAFPGSVPTGSSLSGLAASMSVTLPAELVGALASAPPTGFGIQSIGGSSTDAAFLVGATKVPLSGLEIPSTPLTLGSPLTLVGSGVTGAGKAPAPGDYNVTMPKQFSFIPVATPAVPLPPIPCTMKAGSPSKLGTMHVSGTASKVASTVALKLKNKPITTSKRAKLLTIVTAAGKAAKGTVVAKEGTKKLASGTLTSGRKVLLLPKLKKGAHTIKVIYKGNATTKASSKKISFTVKRG